MWKNLIQNFCQLFLATGQATGRNPCASFQKHHFRLLNNPIFINFHLATWLFRSLQPPKSSQPPHPLVFVQLYFSFSQVLIRHAAKLDRDQNWISLDPCFATARVQAAVQILSNLQDSSSLCQCHPFFSFFSIFERFRTLDCLQNSTGLSWQSFLEGRTSTVSCPAFRICSW